MGISRPQRPMSWAKWSYSTVKTCECWSCLVVRTSRSRPSLTSRWIVLVEQQSALARSSDFVSADRPLSCWVSDWWLR